MNHSRWRRAALIYFSLLLLATPTLGLAYVDPSVTSYALQAIVGVAVAAGAFFAVYWRRAKKKVQDKLGLEDRTIKEQEADVQVFDAPGNDQ